ncbi:MULTISPECIES: zinc-dependent peptidase [Shewanella]|jgi:hypothetical protein|uniref:Mlc titration factor A n=3 Tax=Bacteria TaxID=2 RepID=A0A380CA91_9GAMM|nr:MULTISPECIES: M90 family metallopeptidase [Shewanella]MBO2547243.1 zinc-dependent peptidase [Shewanella algae]MBO2556114.1 zinc-dependent peptidase [Shewanella algae]MBO2568892.1 zinc-dependent peptidase [Shewanella algae]MBO2573047.1 zinc-dependent peptidase [Shewanella algae]MBO2581769.1 zinc-dependent peptidase [Shewanella algae]
MLAILITLAAGASAIGWILSQSWRDRRRRDKIRAKPFPKEWRTILKKRMPYFRSLPSDLQLQLKKHIQVFLAEKQFVGCDGLEIDDEIRLTIAAQACLLLLNRQTDYYPNLRQILVYPSAFIVRQQQRDANGLEWHSQRLLAGESWGQGKVVLSWQNTLDDAADPADGRNVVIHEFAHQLDQEAGDANGAPRLGEFNAYPVWSQVLGREFAKLQAQAASGEPSLFSYYGATNPAEFFAVISEVFFEQPQQMRADYPALYQELSRFYRLDPLSWH